MWGGWVIAIIIRYVICVALIFAAMMAIGAGVLYFLGRAAMDDALWVVVVLVIVGQIAADILTEWRHRAAVRRFMGKENDDAI